MALADILERIEADAASEAAGIIDAAEARSEAVRAAARDDAARARARTVERASDRAASEAATTVAAARLAARDGELRVRRELVERALVDAEAAIAALPVEGYARFLARRIVAAAAGGERVLVAKADRARLGSALKDEVARLAPRLRLEWPDEAPPSPSGCLLDGGRVRAEVSAASAIAERRAELEMAAARALFGEEA